MPVTVGLLPLDDGIPVADLAAGLGRALGRHGRVAVLDGSEVELPANGTSPATVYGPLLDRSEASADHVLLVGRAGPGEDPWTSFCLQQADRVLAIARGGAPPAGAAARPELRGADLVGWDVELGSGRLAAWAAALEPAATHVLRRGGLDEDLGRLARRLAGRSLGVVLSGGGARALSHIGVLEELTAAGVVIDRVAGVSMGAMVGALFALGMDGDEIDARIYDEWVRRRPLGDYTLPRHGLIRGARAEAMFKRLFGPVSIEELACGFTSGAADLRTGELVLSRVGPLADAVGTSMCIPVLAPPQVRGKRVLIDGSFVDNLPVGAVAVLGEGPVVAVDVKATFERGGAGPRRAGAAAGVATGGDGATAGSGATPEVDGAPTALRVPGLAETLMRVLLLGSASTSEAALRHADLLITPRTPGIGLLEFHQLDRAREAGRAAARAVLDDPPAVLREAVG
jgi:predicted acylesterase/phospholipase RssA